MTAIRDIKTAQQRAIKAITLRPAVGQGTATTRARLRGGVTACDVSDGEWRLVVDVGTSQGGEGGGPDPGVLGRGALASCLAIGYRLWAARMDVVLDDVTVTVESDYDARGMYGLDAAVAPGWQAVRVTVEITSATASEEQVRAVVAAADAQSPLLDDFTRALEIGREIRISAGGQE